MGTRAVAIFGLLAGGGALAWYLSRQDEGSDYYAPAGLPSWGGDSVIDAPVYAGAGQIAESYLRGQGIAAGTAKGVVAGVWAESLIDPTAVNPTSGAFGIGQWLGSRKAELFRRYGSQPSFSQQLEFLAWELNGGDHGGKAVLAQSTPAGALDAYLRRFMRPAAGAETTGDLARGSRYLG